MYVVPYDSTPFVKQSIEEVVKTLIEAIILVFIVMFLFLQNWRATLIPTIAVPVVLLGTFGVLAVFGYSINTLTMFGLVLAIGLLVDDAIVVVENVERVMSPRRASRRVEATRKSMRRDHRRPDRHRPGFVGGLRAHGLLRRLAGRDLPPVLDHHRLGHGLSVLVALILTPALCATLLKPVEAGAHGTPDKGFFGWFNRSFNDLSSPLPGRRARILGKSGRWMAVYGAIIVVMGLLFMRLPTAFLPEEDQGTMLHPGPTARRRDRGARPRPCWTRSATTSWSRTEKDAVKSVFTVSGFSFAGAGQNAGLAFIRLKPFDERKAADLKAAAVAGRAMGAFSRSATPWSSPSCRRRCRNWATRRASTSSSRTPAAWVTRP